MHLAVAEEEASKQWSACGSNKVQKLDGTRLKFRSMRKTNSRQIQFKREQTQLEKREAATLGKHTSVAKDPINKFVLVPNIESRSREMGCNCTAPK